MIIQVQFNYRCRTKAILSLICHNNDNEDDKDDEDDDDLKDKCPKNHVKANQNYNTDLREGGCL